MYSSFSVFSVKASIPERRIVSIALFRVFMKIRTSLIIIFAFCPFVLPCCSARSTRISVCFTFKLPLTAFSSTCLRCSPSSFNSTRAWRSVIPASIIFSCSSSFSRKSRSLFAIVDCFFPSCFATRSCVKLQSKISLRMARASSNMFKSARCRFSSSA